MKHTEYKIELPTIEAITQGYGLGPGGATQLFFASEVIRASDPFVPMASGVLKNSGKPVLGGTHIEYQGPYARVHWYGKVMTGSAPKEPTDIDMKYTGAPKRGPKWVERAWAIDGDNIIKATEKFARRYKK